LRPYLQRCGYSDAQLQKNYTYADSSGDHNVPLVGFAYETCDARDACVAALDANFRSVPDVGELVADYDRLGAPVFFACGEKELQWWSLTTQGAKFKDKVSADQAANFFHEHRTEFAPKSIYRAKTLGRLDPQHQLTFVDIGLMPLFEHEMGDHLSKLIKRMCAAVHNELEKPKIDEDLGRWLFQSVFRLLAAKILTDKKVLEFSDLNLDDVSQTLRKVHSHYTAEQPAVELTRRQEKGLRAAAKLLKEFGSLRHLTIESLAYVYENTLITKEIRKALGIHATPSYLVDYIVWQLAPWIEQIPQGNRVVLEPACGHAPFLVSAARLLREMIDEHEPKKRHGYLKDHLFGVDKDLFAREIARLSLTLADVPNPNGWQLVPTDIYRGDALSHAARRAGILLCNPPFEDFTVEEQRKYARQGAKLRYFNKAAEVLARTLPYMRAGSVFGVIVPQGFLHASNLAPLRQLIVQQFELSEICALPENVFTSARHKSAFIFGRKMIRERRRVAFANRVRFKTIQQWELKEFKDRYYAPTEVVLQSRFNTPPTYDLRLEMLEGVWRYCQRFPFLANVADVGRGLEYKTRNLPAGTQTISTRKFAGSIPGYDKFAKDIKLTETPKLCWMNLAREVISRPRWGTKIGTPQVLLNSVRVGHGPWRLKALIDNKGHPVTTRFIVVRPKTEECSLKVLWAILNSPLANAYAYCKSLERNNLTTMVRHIPLPDCEVSSFDRLDKLVEDYFLFSSSHKVLHSDVENRKAEKGMLAIDAEVLRLYDLPPRLERQLLDLFDGWERKGVDFKFTAYFPTGFESWIPLHEYLSEEYQRSTVSFVNKWVEEARSPEVIKALEAALEAFEED